MTGDGRWFADRFEDSRFDDLWQFRFAGACKMLAVAAGFALAAVVTYRFAASGGLIDPLLFYQHDPPQTVPAELESLDEPVKSGVLFIQTVWFIVTQLLDALVHLLVLVAIAAFALAAGVAVLFAGMELELAYRKPIDTEGVLEEVDDG